MVNKDLSLMNQQVGRIFTWRSPALQAALFQARHNGVRNGTLA